MNARLPLSKIFIASLIVLLASALVAAQQNRGTLRGVVTDELGAVIVGASVAPSRRKSRRSQALGKSIDSPVISSVNV